MTQMAAFRMFDPLSSAYETEPGALERLCVDGNNDQDYEIHSSDGKKWLWRGDDFMETPNAAA
jgi:hypothetical protein